MAGEVSELLPAVEDELQLGEQGVCMEPDAPIEGDEFPVEVVEDLEPGRLFRQENGESASERFDVAGMITDFRKDIFEQPGFSSGPRDGWFYFVWYDGLFDGAFCAWVSFRI